ncbi:MAG: alpha/beta fold hydrolase [Rhodoferax sp.]|nr:alpha/beta fold hydrolase [Rhodoferax sp.]
MLAKLLRRLLLTQVLVGACIGYGLAPSGTATGWWVVAWGLGMPFLGMVLIDVISAVKSRAHEGAGVWWRSLWGEMGAGFKIFIFRQPWSTEAPQWQPALGTTPRIPVVLVHGYMCNHRIWDDVALTLRTQGHAVFAVNLEPLFTSIDRYAPIIENAVDTLCRQTGAQQVALVGHSMGGLAIRAWLRAQGAARAAQVITLGTPHAGTQIVPWTHTPNGKQMCWQSDWLSELAASESAELRARMRIALTPQDNIVYPQRAQVLPSVLPTVFDGIGHVEMCLDPQVIRWLLEELKDLPHVPSQP